MPRLKHIGGLARFALDVTMNMLVPLDKYFRDYHALNKRRSSGWLSPGPVGPGSICCPGDCVPLSPGSSVQHAESEPGATGPGLKLLYRFETPARATIVRVGNMRNSEQLWSESQSRRAAVKGLAGFLIGGPALFAQQDAFRDHSRVPGLSEMLTAFDFEEVAYAKLPRQTYNYTAHGGGGENTVRRNREAFNWVDLVAKSASKLTTVDTSTEVLGTKMQFPIMVAPTAAHLALHPSKEPGTYRGCTAAAATPYIVSHVTSTPFEEVAPTADGPLWFQLYPREVLEDNRPYLERAQNAGSQAIVVTIDQQSSYYDRQAHDVNLSGRRARPAVRPGTTPQNPYRFRSTRLWYEWKLFDGLRPMIKVPMLAKGILTAEDARRCIDHGLDGIIVSNHGGRGLDYSPSSLEVLPEIVDAVGGRIPVLVDSGFRRGEDILKALALGAKAVCLGRVPRWGLGAFGPNGVQKVLEILQAELVLAMRQAGVPNLAAIDRSLVRLNLP